MREQKGETIRRRHKGQHLQWSQRLIIERMRLDGATTRQIADVIGCSHVCIARELKRGRYIHTNSDLTTEERYSPEQAEHRYRANLAAKGPQVKIGNDHEYAKALEKLIVKKRYSPSAALAAIRNRKQIFRTSICPRTLYNYIANGILACEKSDLPLKGKQKRRNRSKKEQIQKRVSCGTSIEYRPAEVDARASFGHWEMDTVYTSKKDKFKPTLLVLTERCSRQEMIIRMRDRTSGSVVRALNALERSMGADKFSKVFQTITVDNGSEFSDFEGMEKSVLRKRKARTKVYYCHAHRSYERGSNENANKLIRRHFPKGTDLSKVSVQQVAMVEAWINDYPRRILGWKTSNMIYRPWFDRQ